MFNEPNMGLVIWNSATDVWNHEQLANNFRMVGEHDHSGGRGKRVPTDGIEDGAITPAKLSPDASAIDDDSIDTKHLKDGAVTNPKLALKSVATDNLLDDAVTTDKIRDNSVYARQLRDTTACALGIHPNGRRISQFQPGAVTSAPGYAKTPTSGTDLIKIKVPPGGGLVHVYAEGTGTLASPGPGGYAGFKAFASWSVDSIISGEEMLSVRQVVASATVHNGGSFQWKTSPEASEINPYSRDPSDRVYRIAGGAITRFIPAGSSSRTVAIKLELQTGQTATFGQTTFAVWTDTAPFVPYPSNWPDI